MKKYTRIIILLIFSTLHSETIDGVFPLPGYSNGYYAYGLAFDGEYLWIGDDYNGMIYKMDTLGNVVSSFMGITGSNHGLAWDGEGLWCAGDYSVTHLIKFNPYGSRIDSVAENWQYIGGLGYNGNQILVTVYYPNTNNNIYLLDPTTGITIGTVSSPGTQPQGVTFDGQYIWVVMDDNDGDPERVWKIDPATSETLMSFPVPTTSPRGLAWSGTHLWLIAMNSEGSGGVVYKINPYGGGVPEISLNITSYDFGNVILGEAETLKIVCTNIGSSELSIDSTKNNIPAFSVLNIFPIMIPPSNSDTLFVVFSPPGTNTYSDTLSIFSNDPMHDSVAVSLRGTGVSSGQDIDVADTILTWDACRTGASKRKWLNIANLGSATLTVDSVRSSSATFMTTSATPFNIDPSSQEAIDIWFSPELELSYIDTLYIYSNDPDEETLMVYLNGTGVDTTYSGGDIIWYYYARGGSVYNHIRSIKSISDINNDGKDDAVAVSENDTLYLIHGNGFQEGDPIWKLACGTCYTEHGLTVVPDLNDDGYEDVVLGTIWGSRKVFAISGKDGNVLWQYDMHQYGDGGWVYEVSYAPDINGDGIVEILAAAGNDSYDTGPKRAFMFDGATGTVIWQTYLTYSGFSVRVIGDINNDGYPEVATGTGNGSTYAYWIYLLSGLTGNIIWSKNVSGAVWTVIPLQDINDDGIPDIAAGLGNGQVIALNGINGNILWTYTMGGIVTDLNALRDVNGNGYFELLPAGAAISNFVAIDSRTGTPVWSFNSGDAVFSMVEIPDISGDGKNEVIGGTGYNVNRLALIDGATGNMIWSKTMQSPVETVYPIKDIDANGTSDILVGLRNGDILCVASGPIVGIQDSQQIGIDLARINSNIVKEGSKISLTLLGGGMTCVEIFDVSGRCVATLLNQFLTKGTHNIPLELDFLPNGVYFIRIRQHESIYSFRILKIL